MTSATQRVVDILTRAYLRIPCVQKIILRISRLPGMIGLYAKWARKVHTEITLPLIPMESR